MTFFEDQLVVESFSFLFGAGLKLKRGSWHNALWLVSYIWLRAKLTFLQNAHLPQKELDHIAELKLVQISDSLSEKPETKKLALLFCGSSKTILFHSNSVYALSGTRPCRTIGNLNSNNSQTSFHPYFVDKLPINFTA